MKNAVEEKERGGEEKEKRRKGEEEASGFCLQPSGMPEHPIPNAGRSLVDKHPGVRASTRREGHPQGGTTPTLLRPYQPADYPTVLALWEEAKLRPYTEVELARLLASGGGALVAVVQQQNETVVGVVLWSHNGSVGILWRLAVSQAYRGQGIATQLLDRVEQDIREAGLGGVTLLTRTTNTVARSVYAKRGYKGNDHLEFWGKKLTDVSDTASETHTEAKERTTC